MNRLNPLKYWTAGAMLCLGATSAQATFIVDGLYFGFQMPGTTIQLDLVPEKPIPGDPFTVVISGVANEVCPPVSYQVVPFAVEGKELRINADTQTGDTCDVDALPIDFREEFQLGSEFWDTLEEPEEALIRLYVRTGQKSINTGIPPSLQDTSASWVKSIDLQRGTHTIPPRLGSGYWVSETRPNESLLIEQQGDRVVIIELGYGEEKTPQGNHVGAWIYSNATFSGDSANGISTKVARPDLAGDEVTFEETWSASLVVDDVNHVRMIMDAGPREAFDVLEYESYRRWSFNRTMQERPAVVPDFSGGWTVLRFDGSAESERERLAFDEGVFLDTDRWRFTSLDGAASLTCAIDNHGEGDCTLAWAVGGEEMQFGIENFNGNVASGAIRNEDGQEGDEAVFLREPFDLPGLE